MEESLILCFTGVTATTRYDMIEGMDSHMNMFADDNKILKRVQMEDQDALQQD